MHGSRRRMSINKWKKIEELYRKGEFGKASALGGNVMKCGHCIEYDDCYHCPISDVEGGQCNALVLYANKILDFCFKFGRKDRRALHAIRRVQKLVAEK